MLEPLIVRSHIASSPTPPTRAFSACVPAMMSTLPPPLSAEHPVRQQFRKTKLCRHFERRGVCWGDCPFAHASNDLRTVPDLRKTAICAAWSRGECSTGHCRFAHGVSELRGTPALYKTQLCHWYSADGQCSRGAACRHAHGEGELRHTEPEAVRTDKPVYAI